MCRSPPASSTSTSTPSPSLNVSVSYGISPRLRLCSGHGPHMVVAISQAKISLARNFLLCFAPTFVRTRRHVWITQRVCSTRRRRRGVKEHQSALLPHHTTSQRRVAYLARYSRKRVL